MRLFGRRRVGRHELGAAVVGLPSGPPAPVVTVSSSAPVAPPPSTPAQDCAPAPVDHGVPGAAAAATVPGTRAEDVRVSRPALRAHVGPAAPRPPAPRVQLGFRDGSTAALDPTSAQSLALEELARSLSAPRTPTT